MYALIKKAIKNAIVALTIATPATVTAKPAPVDYVNPYMGNISHLLVPTYPTVHLPNSMLRVYPQRADYTADKVAGLPVIVTSHRGKTGFTLSFYQGDESGLKPSYMYSYDREEIKPYYYASRFDESDVTSRFAPGHRAAVYDIEFEKTGTTPYLLLMTDNGELHVDGNRITGYQRIDEKTSVYVCMEMSVTPVKSLAVVKSKPANERHSVNGKKVAMALRFPNDTRHVGVRYGISFIDENQAANNLAAEINHYDVDRQARYGRDVWNQALGKIKATTTNPEALTIFYTSLYRTYERMICLTEHSGEYYSAFDYKVHEDTRPFYTDDWIWDTYRAVHPLRALIEPEMECDMINSFLRMAIQMPQPWMPTFPEVTGDSRRMNSNHGIATVIDLYNKGIRDFDMQLAYDVCRRGITEKSLCPWVGDYKGDVTSFYWNNGYIPGLHEDESETSPEVHHFEARQPVAVSLGTAYDLWCLGNMARATGHDEDAERFLAASLNYRKLFNPSTSFFHPRDKDGKFIEPFDYDMSYGMGARNTYGENNGWVYRWDVPHNIADLIELMGGDDKFLKNLDTMYNTPLPTSKYTFFSKLPDHTGNVGQFSMANEPSMHIPYLYNYAGQPWRTQKRVHTLMDQWFRNDLMGVPGDEDGGGMSAFVVFTMIGFYPVTPGMPMYVIGSPFFETVSIQLPGNKEFKVVARNFSPENKYIQSARLNGHNFNQCWINHEDIALGGKLEFVMGPNPNKEWGTASLPPSFAM